MTSKPFWTSKTVWVNALALAGSIALSFGMAPEQWAPISVGVLAVANVILRSVTGDPIDWSNKE